MGSSETIILNVLSNFITDFIKKCIKNNISSEKIAESFRTININELNIYIANYVDIYSKDANEQNKAIQKIFDKDYKTNFARRLDVVIDLMNYNRNENATRVNLASLSNHLGYDSENALKKYYIYEIEPKYEEINRIANGLGVNYKWLSGELTNDEPFRNTNFYSEPLNGFRIRAQKFYNDYPYNKAEYFFAMKDLYNIPEIILVRKIDEFKYESCEEPCLLYDSTGNSGRYDLAATYRLLRKMKIDKKCDSDTVCFLDYKMFDNLKYGEIYPGSIKKYWKSEYNHLIDDFLELTDENINYCEKKYGNKIAGAMKILSIGDYDLGKDH